MDAAKCDQCGAYAPVEGATRRRSVGTFPALPESWVLVNAWRHRVDPRVEDSDIHGEFCTLTCAANYLMEQRHV